MSAFLLAVLLAGAPAQPAAISGRVTDSQDSILPGATVQLEVAGTIAAEVQTGSDGAFAFPMPSPGAFRLIVTAPGFTRTVVTVPSELPQALTIALEPAPFFEAVQVTSSRGDVPAVGRTMRRIVSIAWLAILLGFAMQGLVLSARVSAGGQVPGARFVADLVQGITWSVLVCFGVIVLRHRDPSRPRPFRVPFVHVVGTAGAALCFYLMYNLPRLAWERFAWWLAIGVLVYVAYGYRNSKLSRG